MCICCFLWNVSLVQIHPTTHLNHNTYQMSTALTSGVGNGNAITNSLQSNHLGRCRIYMSWKPAPISLVIYICVANQCIYLIASGSIRIIVLDQDEQRHLTSDLQFNILQTNFTFVVFTFNLFIQIEHFVNHICLEHGWIITGTLYMWDVITEPCPNFDGGKQNCRWRQRIVNSYIQQFWINLIVIHSLNPMLVLVHICF